jgi:6-phosphogluconolactonase (cycloisomerase 2 family)
VLVTSGPVAAQTGNPQFVYTTNPLSPQIAASKMDPTTGALTPVAGSPFDERLSPGPLAVDPAGKFVFVANQSTAAPSAISVFKIDQTTGALTEVANSPFSSGSGTNPGYLTVDPTSKFLFVANLSADPILSPGEIDVFEINPATGALTPSPNSAAPGTAAQGPIFIRGIYAHPNGKWLYVFGGAANVFGCDFRQYDIDPATGDLTNVALPPTQSGCVNPYGLGADPQGKFLYAGFGQRYGGIDTIQISQVDGSLTAVGGFREINLQPPGPEGIFPVSMTVDSTGTYLYTNLGSFKIAMGQLTPISTLHSTPLWVADLIGPFVYTGDLVLSGYQISPATGALTPTPGSPYATGGVQFMAITGYPAQMSAPAVSFLPTNLEVGTPLLGSSVTSGIQLFNTGTAPLDITGVSVSGTNAGDFSQTNNCPAALAAGANCTFSVTFTPSVAGVRAASLTVSDNAAGSPHSAALLGVGVTPAPAVTLVPSSLSFSSTVVGSTSASQPLTVTNSGTGPLHISNIGFSGANPGDFTQTNNCTSPVTVNASCTISVSFKPQAVGVRTSSISISDEATNSPQSVGVSGAATAPFSIAPMGSNGTTVTFTPGQTSQYPVQFTSQPNFAGTVTFACNGAPTGTICALSPLSIQVTTQGTTQLMVTVNPTGTATMAPPRVDPGAKLRRVPTMWLVLCFALILFSVIALERAEAVFGRVRLGRFAFATVLFAALLVSACNSSQSQAPAPPVNQPAPGNYPMTIVASSGNASASLSLTLNVQ